MTLPPPPESGFQFKTNEDETIGIRALRTEMVEDNFGNNNGEPMEAVRFEVWPLTGKYAGQFFEMIQTGAISRQFRAVAGDGQMYYGKINGKNVGRGRQLTIGEPGLSDTDAIEKHKAWYAGEREKATQPRQQEPSRPQHDYRNDSAHQEAASAAPPQTPNFAPQRPQGMSEEEYEQFKAWSASQGQAAAPGGASPDNPPF